MSRIPPPGLKHEQALWKDGTGAVAGLDEAGRGAWAGPVAAAAVILPPDPAICTRLAGVHDSKLMTARQRERWADVIRAAVQDWAVGMAYAAEIDALGILPATRLAMQRALEQLRTPPDHLLIDALRLPDVPAPQTALVHGDRLCLSIAAASVLAKTTRDACMAALDASLPGYGMGRHKGYGTALHRAALEQLGASPEHRRSFAPLKRLPTR